MPAYLDESLPFKERARDLVSRMTLEEKVSQTVHSSPAIERLGVPAYNWWNEALHGVARAGVATMFPQAIGMAATFDEALLKKAGGVIATEGRAKYNTAIKYGDRDIYKGLTFWSPNVNIFRDPRWGRGHETYGEDPYLTSRLAVGFIKGLQGEHPRYLKTAACAKHFAVHSGPEASRHEFDAVVSKKDLYETYLPAFEACVREAGAEIVMGAYNCVNGEPCCGSKTLLADILRGEWGFDGHVTSDCGAIKDFHTRHMVTATAPESAAMAMSNGCDLNCGNMYLNLLAAVSEGLVTEETIDESLVRLFTTRMRLGMFDKPEHVPFSTIGYGEIDTPENNALALEAAERSLVLLKNKNSYLPLDRSKINSIAVIGPNADSRLALEGNYCGTASRYVTVLDGIRAALNPGARLFYAPGCHLYKERSNVHSSLAGDRLAEALEAASASDAAVLCLGLDASIEGEQGDTSNAFAAGDKQDLRFTGLQNELLERVANIGKPVILVVMAGSAMDLSFAERHENVVGIIQAWYPGAQGGQAVASLIFGDYSPSARLPVTFYRTTEELPHFEDYSMENRTYRYMDGDALYPFGFGLSYTRFEYGALRVEEQDGGHVVYATLKNTGQRDGSEVSQLYIRDASASLRVPRWSLRGISVNFLKKGEMKEIKFDLSDSDFMLTDGEGRRVLERGAFEIYVEGHQPDERSAELTGTRPLMAEIEI